jgi:RimJ/RimL family protein N-acetyltransferase
LFRAAVEWSWGIEDPEIQRVRLFVHERNARARGLYERLGFGLTGITVPMEGDRADELEIEMALSR